MRLQLIAALAVWPSLSLAQELAGPAREAAPVSAALARVAELGARRALALHRVAPRRRAISCSRIRRLRPGRRRATLPC